MPKAHRAVTGLAFGCVLGLTVAGAASAATLFVDPAGDDADDCLSPVTACATLQAAVDKSSTDDQILLAPGTYAERVEINDRDGLRVAGLPGVVLVPSPAAGGEGHVISVVLSRRIELRDLTLTGNGTADFVGGIAVNLSRDVRIASTTVQDFGGGGIVVFRDSSVHVNDGKIQRNRFHGLRIDQSDVVVFGSPSVPAPAIIADNLFSGVIVNGGNVGFRGAVQVTGNQIGILGEAGEVSNCCGEASLTLRENVIGISLRGGHLELRGPALIEANQVGVRLNGTSGVFGRFSTERVVVRNNGVEGNPTSAGVFLTGSHLDLFTTDVVGNRSRGVLLQDNSSLRLFDALVADNGAEGVRVEALSSARLLDPTILENNGGFDLSCAPSSFATGDASGVQRKFCPGFEAAPRPSPRP